MKLFTDLSVVHLTYYHLIISLLLIISQPQTFSDLQNSLDSNPVGNLSAAGSDKYRWCDLKFSSVSFLSIFTALRLSDLNVSHKELLLNWSPPPVYAGNPTICDHLIKQVAKINSYSFWQVFWIYFWAFTLSRHLPLLPAPHDIVPSPCPTLSSTQSSISWHSATPTFTFAVSVRQVVLPKIFYSQSVIMKCFDIISKKKVTPIFIWNYLLNSTWINA